MAKNKKKGKMKKYIIIGVIVLIIVALYLFFSYSAQEAMKALSDSYIVEHETEIGDIEVKINQSGSVSPYRKYEIYPTFQGEVTRVNYEIGESVKKDGSIYRIGGYDVKSPMAGTLISSTLDIGDYITNIQSLTGPIAVVADISKMITILEIDELDINLVKVGMEVEITSDSVEGKTFIGKITKIDGQGKNVNGVTTYEVTVEIDEPGDLKVGMNIDTTIVVLSKESVLRIPMDAINKSNGKTYVYVRDENITDEEVEKNKVVSINAPSSMESVYGYKKQEVEVGINNQDYIEILSGIDQKDKIYTVTSTKTLTEYMMEQAGSSGMSITSM